MPGLTPRATKAFLLELRICNKPLLYSGAAVTLDTSIYIHETRMPSSIQYIIKLIKNDPFEDNVTMG